MPNLVGVAERGVFFDRHHAIYPTVTRVNAASIATGAHPATHGLLGNTVYLPRVSPEPLSTSVRDNLLAIAAGEGRLLTVPTLGDALATAGLRLFVGSAGSSGSSYLLDPDPDRGTIVHLEYAVPARLHAQIVAELGPVPAEATPNAARNAWIVSAYLHHGMEADVGVLWLSDPDHTTHEHGIGSAASLASLTAVDAEIGRIVGELEARGELDRTNLLVTSDHGFSTHTGELSLSRLVATAAAELGMPIPVVAGSAIHLQPGSEDRLDELADALRANPAVGAMFSAPSRPGSEIGRVPGTLSFDAIEWSHPRSAALLVAPRGWPAANAIGWPGLSSSSGTAGHGGAGFHDVRNTLVAAGPAFRRGARSDLPSSNADLAPTICALLQIACPPSMTGRPLVEALSSHRGPQPRADGWQTVVSVADYRLVGTFHRVAGRRYFESATVER